MSSSSSTYFFKELIHFLFHTHLNQSYYPSFSSKNTLSHNTYVEYGFPNLYKHYPHNKADYISIRKMIMMMLITDYLHKCITLLKKNEEEIISISEKGLEMIQYTMSRLISEKPCRKRKNYNIEKIAYVMFRENLHKRKKYRKLSVSIRQFAQQCFILPLLHEDKEIKF